MARPEPHAKTIFPWLRANLGKTCLAPLTGTDARALMAAVEIMELYSVNRNPAIAECFGTIVTVGMQEKCWPLAYHAIAHVLDWSDRRAVWSLAKIPPLASPGICSGEPHHS